MSRPSTLGWAFAAIALVGPAVPTAGASDPLDPIATSAFATLEAEPTPVPGPVLFVQDVGRFASASSRDGRWLTEDGCTSTRVAVARGRAAVRDLAGGRKRTVRKGRAVTIRGRG
jgi:hypothetical protein